MNWFYQLMQNQVFQTILAGTLVYTLGSIIEKFILEPVYKYKETIAKIDNKLKFYGDVTGNPGSDYPDREIKLECRAVIRNLSCELESNFKAIPFGWQWTKEEKYKIADSAKRLIRLSNNIFNPGYFNTNVAINNYYDEEAIRANLHIPKFE